MKKTKILVPAVAILALGMAASVTGTVAWFSQNTRVTADGMSLTAVTSKSLMISLDSADWKNSVTMESTTKTDVLPVSPVTAAQTGGTPTASLANTGDDAVSSTNVHDVSSGIIDWYRVNIGEGSNDVPDAGSHAAQYSIANAISGKDNENHDLPQGLTPFGSGTTQGILFTSNGVTDYYAKDDIYLQYTDQEVEGQQAKTSPVDMTITVAAAANNPINSALHVGVYDVSAKKLYNYDVGGFQYNEGAHTLSVANFVTLTNKQPKQYTVFGWFEGEDPDCTTQNSINVVQMNISLAFALAQA